MSSVRTSIAAGPKLERQVSKTIAWPKATGGTPPDRAQAGVFTISPALVADRLRCMLEHVRGNHARQVLLDVIAIASALQPISPQAEVLRDLVQEAHGLFLRGNAALAGQRLHDALHRLETGQEQPLRADFSHLRRRAARV